MSCECFDARVALAAIYKGFKDAHKFGDTPLEGGLKAIRHMVGDIGSRAREIKSPTDAYFRTKLERRINPRTGREELFWEGYDRSIRESMRRGVAWLRLHKADSEEIAQAKLEYYDWVQSEKTILDSNGDIPVRFFSSRDGDATLGMAFHQVSWQNGELVLESQLLPIGQMEQIEALRELVGNVREPIDFKQDLPGMIQKSLLVNQGVGVPIHMIESMSGGAGADVHLGSGHEGVSVGEVPVYALPVVVADVQPYPRGGVEVVAEKVVVPTVTRMIPVSEEAAEVTVTELPRYEEVTVSDVHLGSVHEDAAVVSDDSVNWAKTHGIPQAEKFVSRFARNKPAEYQGRESVKIEEVITENTEVIEGTEEVVVPMVTRMIPVSEEVSEVTVTELPRYEEVTVSESDVHLGSVHGAIVNTEITVSQLVKAEKGVEDDSDLTLPVVEQQVTAPAHQEVSNVHPGSVVEEELVADHAGERKEFKSVKIEEVKQKTQKLFFSDFSFNPVSLVIKEMFNEQVIEHKRYQSVKAKVIGLQRQIANVVADQLIGRVSDTDLGWLVHGLALMRFDGIEEKQEMRRFRLSPVRAWADRVTKVAKRVKDKFVRISLGAYRHLFATV